MPQVACLFWVISTEGEKDQTEENPEGKHHGIRCIESHAMKSYQKNTRGSSIKKGLTLALKAWGPEYNPQNPKGCYGNGLL